MWIDYKTGEIRQKKGKNKDASSSSALGIALDDRRIRDELLIQSVKQLKMTADQIYRFSKTWRRPFSHISHVYRRCDELKLHLKQKDRQSLHDEFTLEMFVKIAVDAHKNGLRITGVTKEYRVKECRIKADMHFFINSYEFFLENQISQLTFRGWSDKLGKYLKYRKDLYKKPFRTLVVFENEAHLYSVYQTASKLMEKHPRLHVFLFGAMRDLLAQPDVVSHPVWVPARERNPVFLVKSERCLGTASFPPKGSDTPLVSGTPIRGTDGTGNRLRSES